MFRQRFYFKTDQWDGFRSERRALLEACTSVDNLVVLSGDLHGFYAAELHADFDAPGEPLASSTRSRRSAHRRWRSSSTARSNRTFSSRPWDSRTCITEFDGNLASTNPHIKYAESTANRLAPIVEVGPAQVDVRFLIVSDVTSPTGRVNDEVAFRTPIGSRRVVYSPPCSG